MTRALPSAAALPWLLSGIAITAPFAIEGTLPALPSIGREFGADDAAVQQSLTAFFAAFASMMLVHGALADALGRRTVLITGGLLFAGASAAAALAGSLPELLAARFVQGLTAGAGIVVGRAVIRDLFVPQDARRVQSFVVLTFALAPALAPVVAGALVAASGWRAVFALLAAIGAATALAVWRWLPETLAPANRRSLRPSQVLRGCSSVFAHPEFRWLAAALALLQAGTFVYLASAARIVEGHLQLGATAYGWLSLPIAAGMMVGAFAGGRLALRLRAHRQVWLAAAILATACASNLALAAALPPTLPVVLAPPTLYAAGVALASPTLQMLMLERFGDRAGTASSCLAFVQTATMGLVAGLVVPFAFASIRGIAAAQALLALAGVAAWFRYRQVRTRPDAPMHP